MAALAKIPLLTFLVVEVSASVLHVVPTNATNADLISLASAERELVAVKRLQEAQCDTELSKDDLQLGLRLGAQFLVKSQREHGNFRYEYNWLSHAESEDDNPVRQAGTLWGLALLHVDSPHSGLLPTIRNGLAYFKRHSVEFSGGVRLMNYPGQDPQKIGSVALLALTHIEVLRRPEALEGPEEKALLETQLEGYLRGILAARTKKHNFHKFYNGSDGQAVGGTTSPYFDGECLLALVKAAKYLGHGHLWKPIKVSAEAGYRKNAALGLKLYETKAHRHGKRKLTASQVEKAVKRMKGYYQWGSMAWYELLGVEDPEFSKYAKRSIRYGDWMAGKAPKSKANTGYAYEGLIPSFVTAVQQGDRKRERRLACAIRTGVKALHSFQVGHTRATGLAAPLANPGQEDALGKDENAQGGAQGSRSSAALRIDTTQHQLHSLLMARRLLEGQALI